MAKWYISVGLCLCCWSNLCAYKVVNGRIILDKEESNGFLKDIFHTDLESLKKRDAFIKGSQNWVIQRLGNGRTIIDIPDLELYSI